MSLVKVTFSNTTPEAPEGYINGTWQADGAGNYSLCVPVSEDSFVNPMLDEGDIIYEDASLGPARLPIGAAGDVLTVAGGLPSWQPASSGGGAPFAQTARRTGIVVAGAAAGGTWTNGGNYSNSGMDIVFFAGTSLSGPGSSGAANYGRKQGPTNYMSVSGSTNSLAGIWGYTVPIWMMGFNINFMSLLYMASQITDVRMWVGLTDSLSGSTYSTFGSTDTPGASNSANFIGFRFSSVAGDTNFKCVVSNSSADNVVDSGVVADTKSHRFGFACNDTAGTIAFYIDGVLVATISSGAPVAGTQMNYICGSAYMSSGTGTSEIGIGCVQVQADI